MPKLIEFSKLPQKMCDQNLSMIHHQSFIKCHDISFIVSSFFYQLGLYVSDFNYWNMKSFTYFKADVQSGRIRTLDSPRNEVAILKSSLGFLPQEIILNKKNALLGLCVSRLAWRRSRKFQFVLCLITISFLSSVACPSTTSWKIKL